MSPNGATSHKLGRVLSIDPRIDRVAWTLFQDSAIRDQRIQTVRTEEPADRVQKLIVPYLLRVLEDLKPHAVIVPETKALGARPRSQHVSETIRAVVAESQRLGIAVHVINVRAIKESLLDSEGAAARNKSDIHRRVIEQYPEMLTVIPKPRLKPWEPERYFEPLFNTAAMYLAWRRQPSPMDVRRRHQS